MARMGMVSARRQIGSVGSLFLLSGIVIAFGLGAFALDFAHMLAVRTELQSATDAAALAGAEQFRDDGTRAESVALAVAQQNTADGRAVSNTSPNTNVVAFADQVDPLSPAIVTATATMGIRHLFAPIFERFADNLVAASEATYYPIVNKIDGNQAFPIAVSLDQWPNGPNGAEKPVNQLRVGDEVTIIVNPSGTPGRNAAWTAFNISSANTNTYTSLIEQVLEISPIDPANAIPPLEAGVSQILLDNGLNQGTHVDTDYNAPITGSPYLVIPMFDGNQFNQQVMVRGFLTVKVRSINIQSGKLTIIGTIVKGAVRGWGGTLPNTGNAQNDNALDQLSAVAVKLTPRY